MDVLEVLIDDLSHQLKLCDEMLKQVTYKLQELQRKRRCRGCQEEQPNQLAHYGGCIDDPNE